MVTSKLIIYIELYAPFKVQVNRIQIEKLSFLYYFLSKFLINF